MIENDFCNDIVIFMNIIADIFSYNSTQAKYIAVHICAFKIAPKFGIERTIPYSLSEVILLIP